MSKPEELRGMSDEQLNLTLRETTEHLFRLNFQSATEKVEAPSEIQKARREIARIKTLLRERELKRARETAASQ
jgi:large subunit ribosomal protein L29